MKQEEQVGICARARTNEQARERVGTQTGSGREIREKRESKRKFREKVTDKQKKEWMKK